MSRAKDELLSPADAGRRYPGARGAAATVTRWITDGCSALDGRRIRLTATRCGGRWLIRPTDLDAFFAELARPSTPDGADVRAD